MTDIDGIISELADLWPALAAALARDAAGSDAVSGSHAWAAAVIVNADVLAAMITLDHGIPETARCACEATGEPWQHRGLEGCLLQIPRLAARMRALGMAEAEKTLAWQAAGWLRVTKRALGLRKPDIPLGYPCPYAGSIPEEHTEGRMLFMAGAEGCLRDGPDGLQVEWTAKETIYCASGDCGASWNAEQWPHLGRMLRTPAMVST